MRIPSFKLLAVAAVLAMGTSHHVLAQDMSTPELTKFQLENGLEVILVPDHKVPKVAVNLFYRVGSLNEPAGRSGFAHLFEHLMVLSGTPTYPEADATFTNLGISWNAFTMEDGTTYVASGMASTLPVVLSAYADQMANIGSAVDQADLDLQRSVVLNEMRQNVLDAPGAGAVTAMTSAVFPNGHPYSRAVLGSIPDLQAATLDDVQSFFNAYYGPNNAVLVVVGDFDVEDTKEIIDDTFGIIPRGADVIQPTPAEFDATRVRMETVDALAAPLAYFSFTGPDANSDANAALFMAADLMSNESGILREKLINTGLATYAGATWDPGTLGGRFSIYAGAGPNVTAEQLEAALKDAISEFVASPINAADLERTRTATLLGIRTQLEAFSTRAAYIAETMAIEGNIDHVLEDDPDIVAATVTDLEAAIDDVITLDDASVALVRPGPRGDYPAVLSEASGEPAPLNAAERPTVEIPVLSAGGPMSAQLPAREMATLSNGVRVIHYRMEGAPMSHVSASVTGGTNNDPRGKEGLYALAAEMAYRGAGELDLAALGRAAKDIGAGVGAWSGTVSTGGTLTVRPDQFGKGVELLADVLQEPRFDPKEWEVVKAGTLNNLIQRDSDVTSMALRALNEVVFFPKPEDSDVSMTLESVSNITLEDAKTAFEEMVTPKTMVIHSVGDMSIEDVVAALEPRFGSSWEDHDAGLAAKPSLPVVFPAKQQVYVVPVVGTTQATIHIARPAPGSDNPTYPSALAVTNLLAGDFSSRLNSVIREQKGYSYGVSGALWEWYVDDSALTVTIPVQIDATGPALQEALNGFDSLVANPVTDAEVDRTITGYQTVLASIPETAQGFFGALVGMESQGIDLDKAIADAEDMTRLQIGDVQAEAIKLAMLDRAVIIIAGDPTLILPQLAAMGITDVETITMPGAATPAG